MALQTKTISANGSKGHHKFTLEVIENSTSTSANTSSISWAFKLSSLGGGYNWEYSSTVPVTYTVTINGTKYSGNIMTYDGSSTVTIKSGSATITHGTDGAKSISYSFSVSSLDVYYLTGSASASGSMALTKIPRYATSNQSLNSKTETSITMNWSSDSTVDYIWYSKDNGSNWTGINVTDGKSGSYTISGLSANTTYKIKTRVRRKDSQLTTDSSALSVATYDYPYCNNMPDFTLGNAVTLRFYNPLGRKFNFYIIGNGTQIDVKYECSGTSYTGVNSTTSSVPYLYATIPNDKVGKYWVKVVYGSSTIEKEGGTYKIKGTETPTIGSLSYADTDTTVTTITGNNQHIVQNQSNLKVTYTSATAKNSATIAKYIFELNGVTKTSTSAGGTVDFGKVNSSKNLTLTMTVLDSRGLRASTTKTITILAHSNPTATVTLKRLNNYEDETYLTVNGSVSSVNSRNIMSIKYRYKKSGGSYNSFVTIDDNKKQTLSLDKNNVYIFNVVVTDAFGTTYNKEHQLGKGVFPLFIDTVLNSIGINKLPTEPNALEIEGRILGTQNQVLWSGTSLVRDTDTIKLSEPISKQPNGIVLVFSYYNSSTSLGEQWMFHTFFISKYEVAMNDGKGHSFPMSHGNFNTVGCKYLYITNQQITGNPMNTTSGTGNSGIKYDNNCFCLRYVLGV